jgi:(E)-4-hydroxy-3-methylbut-2-enyl-diphosphate synthase
MQEATVLDTSCNPTSLFRLSSVYFNNICKFLQIAIMGCIVNGPGEMADADFGYVGGAPDKIDLYVGKVRSLITLAESLTFLFRNLFFKEVDLQSLIACWLTPIPCFDLQEVVKRGIPMATATDALVQLIKDHGRWVEPEDVAN